MPQIPLQLLPVDIANDAVGEIGCDSQEMIGLAEGFEGVHALRSSGPYLGFGDARNCAGRVSDIQSQRKEETESSHDRRRRECRESSCKQV